MGYIRQLLECAALFSVRSSPHSCQRVTFSCLSRPAGVAATEYRTNSDVTIVRCTNIVPIVSCQIRMLTARNKLASAEDNGVVIHNPLALTHTFQPCRPAYPEAWRHFDTKPRRRRGEETPTD